MTEGKMRIVCISDTHGQHSKLKLPEGDMIIFAGDLMTCGYKKNEVVDFLVWFNALPFKHKIFIAGNHDRVIENNRPWFNPVLARHPELIYLENSGVEIEGLKIWGSPVQPWFYNWAFNVMPDKIGKYWDVIPKDTNILITHGPPYSILDKSVTGHLCGCPTLLLSFHDLPDITHHIFGHIHEGYGTASHHCKEFINASVVDERYRLVNAPIVFETVNKTR